MKAVTAAGLAVRGAIVASAAAASFAVFILLAHPTGRLTEFQRVDHRIQRPRDVGPQASQGLSDGAKTLCRSRAAAMGDALVQIRRGAASHGLVLSDLSIAPVGSAVTGLSQAAVAFSVSGQEPEAIGFLLETARANPSLFFDKMDLERGALHTSAMTVTGRLICEGA